MKVNPRIYQLMAVFCWLGAALALCLEVFLLYMARSFPEVGSFRRDALLVLPLALAWLSASLWFTLRPRREKGER